VVHPSNNPLNVPYYPQMEDGYCLPACIQMVLAYLDLPSPQHRLARDLDVRPPLGAPASNVICLHSDVLDVTLASGSLDDLRAHLENGDPPIVFVQAGEFPHWRECISQHAVVVVNIDEQAVHILDPAASASPISVSIGDFMLAWGELDFLYAFLVRKRRARDL
jgi:ABC-type bacteriocin/lantibiotic exporter with double-glycine peptidase domain